MASEQGVVVESGSEAHAGQYLTFALEEEMYGLQILAVQEIIQLVPITSVPRTPGYVRGVINLRGKVIPVVDLRSKFSMEATEDTSQTCIIVVEIDIRNQVVTVGIVVDRVAEVLEVAPDQVAPPPEFGAAVDTTFILAMGKVGDKVVMLLDIRRVLADGELTAVGEAVPAEGLE